VGWVEATIRVACRLCTSIFFLCSLRGLGAALVQIGHDGAVLTQSVPFGYDGHPIRRAQESEACLALLSVGLDPALGILHADQPNRDSFALDAMEPVRPTVDAFIARGEAISEGHRRNRSWDRKHLGQRDEAWNKREIAARLDAFTLSEIAAATGLSVVTCSRFRNGTRVPHPRHWEPLLALVERQDRPCCGEAG
jgi:hypothetical protein